MRIRLDASRVFNADWFASLELAGSIDSFEFELFGSLWFRLLDEFWLRLLSAKYSSIEYLLDKKEQLTSVAADEFRRSVLDFVGPQICSRQGPLVLAVVLKICKIEYSNLARKNIEEQPPGW